MFLKNLERMWRFSWSSELTKQGNETWVLKWTGKSWCASYGSSDPRTKGQVTLVARVKWPIGQRSSDPQAMGQVTLTENFPDRTVWWGTQTISSLICENKCGFVEPLSYVPLVAKMSQPPIENMVWTNSHAYTQNRINLHNTLYLSKIITLFRVPPQLFYCKIPVWKFCRNTDHRQYCG